MPATGVPVSAETNVSVEPEDSLAVGGASRAALVETGLIGDEPLQPVIRIVAAKHVRLEAPRRIISIAVLLHMTDVRYKSRADLPEDA
jgi:hypothetical protein